MTRRRRRDRGQSLVEFALVIPIIVLLIASFVEIGRAVFAYNTVANAARQGVRVAIVNQLPDVTDCDESRPSRTRTSRTGRSSAAPSWPARRSASRPRT